jgi:hypothetical protein
MTIKMLRDRKNVITIFSSDTKENIVIIELNEFVTFSIEADFFDLSGDFFS